MAMQHHLLREVHPNTDGWKLKIRVVRLWFQHVYMKPSDRSSMDMVLMDEEGTRISASVRTSLVSRFEGLLSEGGVYALSGFAVADNDLREKMAAHSCRITFLKITKMKPVHSGFPLGRSLFSFTAYDDILQRRVAEDQAIDVIGFLSAYTDLMVSTSDGRPTKRILFELQNYERRRLRCTLWSDHAVKFAAEAASFHTGSHVIVIIQLGNVRNWQGRPGVSNCFFGTKVIINGEQPEATTFRERVAANLNIPAEPVKYLDFESLNIDYTLADFAPGCERVLLNDIRELREPKLYVVVGKIVCVQRDQLWYYVGYGKCYLGVPDDTLDGKYTVEDSKGWTCKKCHETGYGFGYRYKIQLRVKDHSGYGSLCLFDTLAKKLLGISAYDLYKSLPADQDEDIFLEEINTLVGKVYVFMVNITRYNFDKKYYVYTIAKISDEAELLGQFPAEMEMLEESNVNAFESDSGSQSNKVVSPGDVNAFESDSGSQSNKVVNPGMKRRSVEQLVVEEPAGSP